MYQFSVRILLLVGLVLAGCQRSIEDSVQESQTSINLEQFASAQSIKTYLATNVASRGFNGQSHCAYEVLGAEATDRGYSLYLWALCQEYYPKDNKLELGTGSSFPIALVVRRNGDQLEPVSHRQPRDGALYAEDMPTLFPKSVLDILQSESVDRASQRGSRLQAEVRKEAGATQ
jgi:hypothetical protein